MGEGSRILINESFQPRREAVTPVRFQLTFHFPPALPSLIVFQSNDIQLNRTDWVDVVVAVSLKHRRGRVGGVLGYNIA